MVPTREPQRNMASRDFDLKIILQPLRTVEFLRDYWERNTFTCCRGKSDFYSRLFSVRDIDSVVQLSCLNCLEEDVKLVKTQNGQFLSLTPPRARDGKPDVYSLYENYHAGYTIIINRMHARWKPIATLCKNTEATLDHPVGANLYFSPAASQGFKPHFDTHDVFILQLAGSKRWRIYGNQTLPLADDRRSVQCEELGEPQSDFILESGDSLYIPRGHIHEACSVSTSSLHLTIAVYVLRWIDLIESALALLAQSDARLREALPPGFRHSAKTKGLVAQHLQDLVSTLTWDSHTAGGIDRLSDKCSEEDIQCQTDISFLSIESIHLLLGQL
jgi:ribosomal protein L16 Arg81 hydroxylase